MVMVVAKCRIPQSGVCCLGLFVVLFRLASALEIAAAAGSVASNVTDDGDDDGEVRGAHERTGVSLVHQHKHHQPISKSRSEGDGGREAAENITETEMLPEAEVLKDGDGGMAVEEDEDGVQEEIMPDEDDDDELEEGRREKREVGGGDCEKRVELEAFGRKMKLCLR